MCDAIRSVGGTGRPLLALHGHLSDPALLVRGSEGVIPAGQAAELVARRPGTVAVELGGDHLLPVTAADELAAAVREFLEAL